MKFLYLSAYCFLSIFRQAQHDRKLSAFVIHDESTDMLSLSKHVTGDLSIDFVLKYCTCIFIIQTEH